MIHDEIAVEVCVPPVPHPSDGTQASISHAICRARQEWPIPLTKSFWIWLLRVALLVGAAITASLCFTRHRASKIVTCFAVATASMAGIVVAEAAVDDAVAVGRLRNRQAQAEWRWRVDYARALTLPDATAEEAALDAAQRYAAAMAPR